MIFKGLLAALLLIVGNANGQVLDTLLEGSGTKLHIQVVKGPNTPILFESGGGLDASQWDSIALVLHDRLKATVITYDRAGFGQSTLDSANYSILREIESLESALARLGYGKSDFILAGHSPGGFYNRVFAARHPNKVKGVVLLDPRIPSFEDMNFAKSYFLTLDRKDFEPGYINLYHLLRTMEHRSDYVRQVPFPGHIPVLNIMAEKGPFLDEKENERFQNAQRTFVQANKNRRLKLAEGSSHNIPNDQPGLVIELIHSFYQEQIH
ncbi:MAG: hypothetical protein BGO21_30725 [Dyadobacter sp. 50-39]|uniref:alpha/beta fold hydrolase n=1 Tax=Dyadobacter sp. 50-39 TaxID=1895756 RepID=UPI00095F9E77|nr:alpha/beta hydrolase [Dyadobacter sp. 50-39]OJV15944.1 MAG: hypothetical protein BGO21_30725 [Dyadobacter sp. 50-39]